MKNLKKLLYLFSACTLFISCDSLVEEVNYQDDPNTVGSVPTLNLISQAEIIAIYLTESDASRYAAINSNSISGSNNQWIGYESYTYSPADFDALWSNIYIEGITQARLAKEQAEIELDDDAFATACFFEAYFLGELAASFGDVPDSEAFVPGNTSPSYDNQATVLNHVQELLSLAISRANGSTLYIRDANGGTNSTSTLGQLAHSMKARYYMISKEYGNALTEAQAGINTIDGGLFGTHADATGAQNMWYNFTAISRPGDTSPVGSYLQELIKVDGTVDRLLATPGEAERFDFYYRANENYNNRDGGVFDKIASLPIIGWHETQLIIAEAAYRSSQEGVARTALNAVRTALEAQYTASFPASAASGNTLLLHILEEKYITLWPSSQTWHDITRTDNALGVTPKTGSEMPQRFLYPQVELNTNSNAPSPIPGLFTPTPVN